MKAKVKLDKSINDNGKSRILRNLRRVLDIKIISLDLRKNVLSFTYKNKDTFQQVKRELGRLGYPIKEVLQIKNNKKRLMQKSRQG